MGEFLAWAATGLVVGLQTWSGTNNSRNNGGPHGPATNNYVRNFVTRQRFFLRQRDGREIEILLLDSGIGFRNGHAITAVWAARRDAPYGHCIYLENHTTGAIARLPENVALIRHKAPGWRVAMFGFLVTFPAALGLLAWILLQRGIDFIAEKTFLASAGIALTLLFVIGVVVSKLVVDYLRADDDHKIWTAADKALANARRMLLRHPARHFPGK